MGRYLAWPRWRAAGTRLLRSEKSQNWSSPNCLQTFVPNFAPKFCSKFPRGISCFISSERRPLKIHQNILAFFNRKRAEYGFGEYGFKHPTRWVFWPSPRELSEFLSVYCFCAKANSPSFSQNSPSLPQNSVSSLFRNSTLETVFRPLPIQRQILPANLKKISAKVFRRTAYRQNDVFIRAESSAPRLVDSEASLQNEGAPNWAKRQRCLQKVWQAFWERFKNPKNLLRLFYRRRSKGDAGNGTEKKRHDNLRHVTTISDNCATRSQQFPTFLRHVCLLCSCDRIRHKTPYTTVSANFATIYDTLRQFTSVPFLASPSWPLPILTSEVIYISWGYF